MTQESHASQNAPPDDGDPALAADAVEMDAATEDDPTPLQIALKWLFNASVAGAVLSLVVHVILLIVAGSILLSRPAGDPRGASREIEVAVTTRSELEEIQERDLLEDPVETEELEMTEALAPPSSDMPALDQSLTASDAGDLSPLGGAGDSAGEGFDTPTGAGSVASFFGVEARGSRFAYIVDRSGSMGDRDRIGVLKSELVESIGGLNRNASFMIFFYSGETRPLGNRTNWLEANERNREMAGREIRAVSAYGGTNPVPAFLEAFKLRPKPDAIYFMTDGVFPEEVASAVHEINAEAGAITPVHTTSFIDRSAEQILRRIARQSGGSYTHVEGPPQ